MHLMIVFLMWFNTIGIPVALIEHHYREYRKHQYEGVRPFTWSDLMSLVLMYVSFAVLVVDSQL